MGVVSGDRCFQRSLDPDEVPLEPLVPLVQVLFIVARLVIKRVMGAWNISGT